MNSDIMEWEPGSPSDPKRGLAWMVIFTDLVSLMLTFFVLLFSMSNVQVDKWESLTEALSQSLNPTSIKAVDAATARFNIASIFRKRAIDLDYLSSILEEAVADDPMLAQSRIMRQQDRLIVALPGDLLFAPGRAVLSQDARQALFNLGGVLRNIGNQIGVNGHSDPNPPKSGEYASNWELSLARAIAVANSLQRSGYTEDIVSFGLADSRYEDLPDLPEEQRLSLGRRVDIVIMPTVGTL